MPAGGVPSSPRRRPPKQATIAFEIEHKDTPRISHGTLGDSHATNFWQKRDGVLPGAIPRLEVDIDQRLPSAPSEKPPWGCELALSEKGVIARNKKWTDQESMLGTSINRERLRATPSRRLKFVMHPGFRKTALAQIQVKDRMAEEADTYKMMALRGVRHDQRHSLQATMTKNRELEEQIMARRPVLSARQWVEQPMFRTERELAELNASLAQIEVFEKDALPLAARSTLGSAGASTQKALDGLDDTAALKERRASAKVVSQELARTSSKVFSTEFDIDVPLHSQGMTMSAPNSAR